MYRYSLENIVIYIPLTTKDYKMYTNGTKFINNNHTYIWKNE
jgi:hypothetical protein